MKKSYFFIIISFFLLSISVQAQQRQCAGQFNNDTSLELKQLINSFNPFWGTWRGTYQGEVVTGEISLDKNSNFKLKGIFGSNSVARNVKFCLNRNRLQLIASLVVANIKIINQRQIQIEGLFIDGIITLKR